MSIISSTIPARYASDVTIVFTLSGFKLLVKENADFLQLQQFQGNVSVEQIFSLSEDDFFFRIKVLIIHFDEL